MCWEHTHHLSGGMGAHQKTAWDMEYTKSPPWVAAAPGRARAEDAYKDAMYLCDVDDDLLRQVRSHNSTAPQIFVYEQKQGQDGDGGGGSNITND